MELIAEFNGQRYRMDLAAGKSIAIPMDFAGSQPNLFEVPRATSGAIESGDFIGDTSRGGSCNVSQLTLIPHCNGTHTESVGHIINPPVPVSSLGLGGLYPALLVSVQGQSASAVKERCPPQAEKDDIVITRDELRMACGACGACGGDWPDRVRSLIVRSLPNTDRKRACNYSEGPVPPYFTAAAMEWIVETEVEHLLVDFPSVDRMHDGGVLANHHLFWNVPEGSLEPANDTCWQKTITEMVFAEDSLADGLWMLNLQIAPLMTDAAPSRPVLYPMMKL
jgi:arylformamidase